MKKRIRKHKLICLIMCIVTLLSVMSGCGDPYGGRDVLLYDPEDNSGTQDQIVLTFFGFKADAMNLTATETAMQSFMAEHKDIEITYEGIKGEAYWEVFDLRDAAGVLDDVVMMHHDHLVTLCAEGKLADLSALPGLENYTDESKGQFTNEDGTVYFLPTSISTYNLYVNYDLLKEHGQSVPENWEEFQACCDYFVSIGIVPIIANNRNSLPTLIMSKGLFDTYQSPDLEAILQRFNEEPLLYADALASGIEQTADMLARGWFDPAEVLVTQQTSDDLNLFVQGERPFMITGGWASSRVVAMEPKFSYGVYPYPILDDGSVLSIQVDTCISINAGSEYLEEAKQFVSYLIRPDVMWEYCDSQASYTPLKEDKRLPSEQTLIPSTQYLSNGRSVSRSDYRISLPTEAALAACADVLLKGGSAAEAQALLKDVLSGK